MDYVQLNEKLELGEVVGAGSYGEVRRGRLGGTPVAVKYVLKLPGAEREPLVARSVAGARNTVPVLLVTEQNGSWLIVMPLADRSLQDELDEGPLGEASAIEVLRDVCCALVDIRSKAVHRDIKPSNVLRLGGSWCLGDFGIAKYVDVGTSSNTRKFSMTAAYAAPEQWRHERATPATDIYSLGILAFQLLTGQLPYVGPEEADFREQHLAKPIPSHPKLNDNWLSLIRECTTKSPSSRIGADQVLSRLDAMSRPPSSVGIERLRKAHASEVSRRAERDRFASEQYSRVEDRRRLYGTSLDLLHEIEMALVQELRNNAPSATYDWIDGVLRWRLRLGSAELNLSQVEYSNGFDWGESHQGIEFDVIGSARLQLRTSAPIREYEGRSHSLWFTNAVEPSRFQWTECGFMASPTGRFPVQSSECPFSLPPGAEAFEAIQPVVGGRLQTAWFPTVLLPGDLSEFISRWAEWLALAADGELARPSSFPEVSQPNSSW